ncbi:MAG TPA: hypothetical protein VF440_03700 [Novosphingobium sp.]
MAETTAPEPVDTAGTTATDSSKARFAKAIEEAKAGVQALGKEAQGRAGDYREKASAARSEWLDEAKAYGNQAKEKATELAVEGKARASEAILTLGKMVEENVETIDARLGPKYGDYARKASTSIQDAAARLDAKDLGEIGEEARAFVRKSPGLAIGLAAVAGYMLARAFRGSSDGASD